MQTQVLTNNRGERAAQVLERVIEQGTANAEETIEQVMSLQIDNKIVPASKFEFRPRNGSGLRLAADEFEWGLHDNALGQMCSRVGFPVKYGRGLLDSADRAAEMHRRRMELLAHNLRELYDMDGGRYLIRSVGDEARAFLTSKYKPLDGKGLMGDFIGSAIGQGAKPFGGIYTDLRYGVTMLVPRVYRLGTTDAVALGVQCKHSDFGVGAFDVSLFVLRLLCENGMTGQDAIRQIHSGKRLDEGFEWSQKTIAAESATLRSAMNDVVGGMLGEDRLQHFADALAALEEKQVSWATAKQALRKKLVKGEFEALERAYTSDDIVNMPAGQNQWRLANALSLIAKQADSERKLELERMAGSYIDVAVKDAA